MQIRVIHLIGCIVLLCSCSSPPATKEDIKAAISQCENVRYDIERQTRPSFGLGSSKPKIVTSSDLQKLLKNCLKDKEKMNDPNSSKNILNDQRNVL